MKTILSSCSARPNFVKLAAVHHALKTYPSVKHVIIHTGQHYDPILSEVFFKQLSIPEPNENLGVKGGNDREDVIQKTTDAFAPILKKYKPDIVLVYGDVNGAVGAARAAKKACIPIAHVEAGLRSFDDSMPEEHNRIEIDRLADFLFVTEQSGINHLRDERASGRIEFVGNTMIDTLNRMMPFIDSIKIDYPKPFAIATLHRPSNVDSKEMLKKSINFFLEISKCVRLILPAHPRLMASIAKFDFFEPGERAQLRDQGLQIASKPMSYLPFLKMMKESTFIITDSGGIQEEATFLKKRCFTLRRNTERPSTVESGANVLIDPDKASDRSAVLEYAKEPIPIDVQIPSLWDGRAGERIVDVLLSA